MSVELINKTRLAIDNNLIDLYGSIRRLEYFIENLDFNDKDLEINRDMQTIRKAYGLIKSTFQNVLINLYAVQTIIKEVEND
jgi:hypothetical protein